MSGGIERSRRPAPVAPRAPIAPVETVLPATTELPVARRPVWRAALMAFGIGLAVAVLVGIVATPQGPERVPIAVLTAVPTSADGLVDIVGIEASESQTFPDYAGLSVRTFSAAEHRCILVRGAEEGDAGAVTCRAPADPSTFPIFSDHVLRSGVVVPAWEVDSDAYADPSVGTIRFVVSGDRMMVYRVDGGD